MTHVHDFRDTHPARSRLSCVEILLIGIFIVLAAAAALWIDAAWQETQAIQHREGADVR